MKRISALAVAVVISCGLVTAQQPAEWVAVSNSYAKQLMDIEMKYTPEDGSAEGLAEYDEKVFQPTLANKDAEWKETAAGFKIAKAPGAWIEATFRGTAIRWVGRKYDDAGIGEVLLDGVPVGRVDLYAPNRNGLNGFSPVSEEPSGR